MGGVFKEQIIKRKPNRGDTLKRVGLVFGVIVIAVLSFSTPITGAFAPFIILAAGFGAWILMSFLNVEYEYAFTDGELDIDAIYNRSRRKRVFSARVNEINIMAHVEDETLKHEFTNAQETHNYSSGVVGVDTYAFMINHKGKRQKIIIEPNAVMLKAMASVLGRRRLHVKA